MKKQLLAVTPLVLVLLMPALSIAGESDTCKGCHNDSVAPSFDKLKTKYTTADELVAGAKKATNPMMQAIKADEAKLKAAAAEIFK